MTEIRILKVLHREESQARKLSKHVEWCDVFSPEMMFCTEQDARSIEQEWDEVLRSGMTPAEFDAWQINRFNGLTPEQRTYSNVNRKQLYIRRKPIDIVYRFQETAAKQLYASYDRAEAELQDALKLVAIGLPAEQEVVDKTMGVLAVMRAADRHAAGNLQRMQARLEQRGLYKPELKYVMQAGYGHKPELFYDKAKSVSLFSKHDDPYVYALHAIENSIERGESTPSLKPLIQEAAQLYLRRRMKT